MKKNSELEVGDIIEVPVSHTDCVTSHVITRVTATQYVTDLGARFNKNLKKLGGRGNRNYDVYGQQPKVVESAAESVAEPVASAAVAAETETITCELNVGDVILTRVPHTTRVRKNVIERITVTQYVCGGTRFRKKDLGIVGANMWGPGYGFLPEPVEPVKTAEPVKVEPVVTAVTVDTVVETGAVAHPTPELTAADHVVVFETESQTRQVLEAANAYTRTAILVQNLESETYIVGVFKSKKAATEAKKNVAGVGRVFDIVVQPSGYTNKAVSFYNIVMLAHAITGENHDKLVTCEHPYWCDGAKGKLYAKIATTESQPVIQEIPENQEATEKPTLKMEYGQSSVWRTYLSAITATPRKVESAPYPAPIGIFEARKVVRFAKSGSLVYAVIKSIDESERDDVVAYSVSFVTCNRIFAKKMAWDDKSELSKACKLIKIREDETFIFEGLDCPAVTYAATVDAQWIMHPNGRWKIYFHDERPEDVSDCSAFEFDGWDLNGEEYCIEFGVGDSDENRDERIVFRVYAKDIMWDGKARDLVCICRHPDALPEDDMGYKRPPVNQTRTLIPWLNEPECKVYEYAY